MKGERQQGRKRGHETVGVAGFLLGYFLGESSYPIRSRKIA